ncbi:MAG: hypothetical protein J07HB67_02825 [halophilic archaeon J07HB67]|jgi:hypothetical protein|nr:MAG: hypothetical protein J07HB67_02825 [halophilic archaeon J07HB67]
MRVADTLATLASKPKATRVLLTLVIVGTLALAADPAAADCGRPPYDEPLCLY